MANDKKTEEEEPTVDIGGAYNKTEAYIDENKRTIGSIIAALVLIFGGYFAYQNLYLAPMNKEAGQKMWKAEYYFEIDSLDKAMYGTRQHAGFKQIADQYSGTQRGELARCYLGICHTRKGNHQQAIEQLEDCDIEDPMMGPVAEGSLGDAYAEMGRLQEAIEQYKAAASEANNDFISPIYLKKAGILYEERGEYENALSTYQKVKDKYPESEEAKDLDKYIARAESYTK